jgi:hypothetical protein
MGQATTFVLAGVVEGTTGNGTFFLQSNEGQRLAGPIPTTPGVGEFAVTLPLFCGEQLLKAVWPGQDCPLVVVLRLTTSQCVVADLRITVTWDDLGDDWELHLIRPGGRINDDATDCTWTSCIGVSPDWGVLGDPADDPHKDVDDLDAFGPENIWLAGPEAGTYTVLLEHWDSGDPGSDGQVTLNVADDTVMIPIVDLAPQHVRTVARITFPGGVIEVVDEDHDCTGNWEDGCLDDLP